MLTHNDAARRALEQTGCEALPADCVAVVDDDDAVRDSLRFLLEISRPLCRHLWFSRPVSRTRRRSTSSRASWWTSTCPDQTGLQLVARLRSQGITLPVALITGSPSPDLIRLARDLDVAEVLEKPLDDEVLLDFIERASD